MHPEITDAAAEHRYEAHVDGELAGVLEYIVKRGRIALVHTEVATTHRGGGIAAQLAGFALAEARRRGLRVIPICRYVQRYLERHPEDLDIVAGATTR